MSLDLHHQRALIDPAAKTRPPLLRFTQPEADAATSLLRHAGPTDFAADRPATLTDGLIRLFDRGLLHAAASTTTLNGLAITWRSQACAATAARHLIARYSHGAFVRSCIIDRIVKKTATQFTDTELAAIFAWHYRYTDTHTLQVTRTGGTIEATEHHHQHAPTTRTCPDRNPDPQTLDTVGVDDYSDTGELLSDPTYTYLLNLLVRGRALPENGGACIDLDTLEVRTTAAEPDGPFTRQLPALTQDALAYLNAPTFATAAEFTDWAEQHLLLTVPCGTSKHRLRLDPHTHRLHTHPNTQRAQERHDGEHLLTAFSDNPALGCDAARRAVRLFGDQAQYNDEWSSQQASALAAARTVARTVQYLDHGVDPAAAAEFLRFGLTGEQAALLVDEQRYDPDRTRDRLLRWAKHRWTSGPTTVEEIELDALTVR